MIRNLLHFETTYVKLTQQFVSDNSLICRCGGRYIVHFLNILSVDYYGIAYFNRSGTLYDESDDQLMGDRLNTLLSTRANYDTMGVFILEYCPSYKESLSTYAELYVCSLLGQPIRRQRLGKNSEKGQVFCMTTGSFHIMIAAYSDQDPVCISGTSIYDQWNSGLRCENHPDGK